MTYRLDITSRLHGQMLEVVRSGLPLITNSMADADLIGLSHLRDEMVSTIDRYCRHAARLRENAALSVDEADWDEADKLVAQSESLRASYDAFRDRWAQRDAVGNWPEYRLSAIVMMKQIRNHIRVADPRFDTER
jgi:hypothetical protein